jgi:anti-anti-sigma regulatory factor
MGSFALGACLGTICIGWSPRFSMFPPVLFLLWLVYQDSAHPIAEIEPSSLVGEHIAMDRRLVVFQLVRQARHRTKPRAPIHRMPNLMAWSERLPPEARVVILDLAGVAHIDVNSAMELRAAIGRASDTGRRLIIAGLTPEQVRQLRESGLGELLKPENTCPDVELAVAQGLNWIGAEPS